MSKAKGEAQIDKGQRKNDLLLPNMPIERDYRMSVSQHASFNLAEPVMTAFVVVLFPDLLHIDLADQ
jgi:histone H3/H4